MGVGPNFPYDLGSDGALPLGADGVLMDLVGRAPALWWGPPLGSGGALPWALVGLPLGPPLGVGGALPWALEGPLPWTLVGPSPAGP